MCKKFFVLVLVLGLMVSMAQANLVITNGTFDGGEPADTDVPDWYDLDTTPAGNTDWWNTASLCGGPNPFPDASAFMGDHLWGGTAGGNRWMYQQIGTKEEGVNYQISFEYAQPTDGSENRSVAIQVDIYQGIFDGAAQDVDIAGQGLTLIESLTSPYESAMVIHSFTSALDLSLANTTDPLWLRISNLGADTGAFVCIDNVQITSESAEPTVPFSLGAVGDITLDNGPRYGQDGSGNGSGLEARDIPDRRHVIMLSYDISALKGREPVSNVSFSHFSHDQHGEVNVYGIIEDLDLLDVESLTWNTAPGVQNDPAPELNSTVTTALNMDELTDVLLTFSGPGETGVRFSTDTSDALADFINSDTDGILTFLIVPSAEGNQLIIRARTHSAGGSFLEGEAAPIANVVFVSFHGADDVASAGAAGAGFTEAADKGYTDLLKANGYNVTRYITTATPDAEVLNAADLVIVGRSVASGGYQNNGATAWNSTISAPMIIMGGYVLRNSRMGFTTGSTIPDTAGDITLAVSDPNHPIFAGIPLTDGTMDNPFAGIVTYADGVTVARGISINTDPVDDEGTVLATVATASDPAVGGMVIGEWSAGATLEHSGGAGTDVLAGNRLVFLSGSREASGVNSETSGMFDLYADGAQMFLNAVKYMTEPVAVPVE